MSDIVSMYNKNEYAYHFLSLFISVSFCIAQIVQYVQHVETNPDSPIFYCNVTV